MLCKIAFGCARILLLSFTIFYGVIGAAILGIGVWFLTDKKIQAFFTLLDAAVGTDVGQIIAIVLVVIGSVLLIVSLTGCCGAFWNNKWLLIAFIVSMGIIAALHLTVAILAIRNIDNLGDDLMDGLASFMTDDYDGGDNLESEAWNIVQVHVECCGVSGKEDYEMLTFNKWEPDPGWSWPKQCCELVNKNDEQNPNVLDEEQCRLGHVNHVHQKGCFSAIENWFDVFGKAVGSVMLTIIAVQTGTIFLACFIIIGIVRQNRKNDGVI